MRRLFLLCLIPVAAMGAEPLSLAQALADAEAQNPSLVVQRLSAEQAEGALVSAQAAFDPRLSVNGDVRTDQSNQLFGGLVFDQSTLRTSTSSGVSGSLPTGTGYRATASFSRVDQEAPDFRTGEATETLRSSPSIELGVSQELLRGHRTAFNRRQLMNARSNLEVAELQVEAQRQRTLADVARSYVAWSHAVRLSELAEERVQIAAEAARLGKLQAAEGRIAPVEVSRLETEAVRARTNAISARQSAAQAGAALLLLLGQSSERDVFPSTSLDMPAAGPIDPARARADALEGNLDLAVLSRQVEQAKREVTLARHGMLPSLTLDASSSFTQVTNKINGASEDPLPNNGYGAGLSFSVPLGNHQARGDVAQAQATYTQREAQLDQQRRQLEADVAQQVRTLESAQVQIELADLEVKLAEQTLAAEEARADAGRALQRDVLDARASLFDAKVRAAKARADRRIAVIELLRLQGSLGLESAAPASGG